MKTAIVDRTGRSILKTIIAVHELSVDRLNEFMIERVIMFVVDKQIRVGTIGLRQCRTLLSPL